MARAHWTIRNYNAALRELKTHGYSHKQAQVEYRRLKEETGKPIYGTDVKRAFTNRGGNRGSGGDRGSAGGGGGGAAGGGGGYGGGGGRYVDEFEDLDYMYEGWDGDEETEY